jgi:GNAT superfamily N-acetyltransferase
VRLTPHGWLALTGEPVPDFNLVYVDIGPVAEEQLREFGERIRARGVPVLVALAPAVAEQLAPVASELGLQHIGGIPLMTYRPAGEPHEQRNAGAYQVERIATPEELQVVQRMLSESFGLPQDSIERFYAPAILTVPDTHIFLARRADEPISTVTTTQTGEIVGVWSMATPPGQQRQGAGRAVLGAAMAYHRDRGARLFYLLATAAGMPLYERTGFRTVEETPVWVAGQSAQFPGH